MQPLEAVGEASLSVDSERFERLEIIGRGSFGERLPRVSDRYTYHGWLGWRVRLFAQVHRWDRDLGREVAIKVIDLEDV